MSKKLFHFFAPILLVVATSGVAVAQESAGSGENAGGRMAGGVLTIDTFVIQGNVEKPQVQYVISRQKIRDVNPLDLKESFLHKIVKAVENEPF